MDEYSNLIKAIATFLWPSLTFVVVLIFRREIGDAIERLKKGKLFGQEVELHNNLETLHQSVSRASDEVASLPKPKELENEDDGQHRDKEDDEVIRSVIHEASHSPKAALMILAAEIEKEARLILASVGKIDGRSHIPITQAIRVLDSHYGLPRFLSSSLNLFWDTRNKLIHGRDTEDGNVLSALDSGITILKSLQALPRQLNIVYKTGVPIYSDPDCQHEITNATGVILESRSNEYAQFCYRIFPTTRSHFEEGRSVAWEWNMNDIWQDAWYRDPLEPGGAIKLAWNSSAEFIGRHLDDLG